MRKFVTVLLMVLMLWTPVRVASASDGGGIVILNAVSAFSKPATFLSIVVLSYVIVSTAFSPQIAALPPSLRTRTVLALTATLTLTFFQFVFLESIRYFIYSLTFPQPYFQRSPAITSATATPEEAQEGLWSASNPEVMAKAAPVDPVKEKEDQIKAAVAAALRNPDVAEKYLRFATPDVQYAVEKALTNRYGP
ncbi:MAG: hypothetical protein CMN56_03440 [Sneathiella sp.]|uniref:hypothetical protein n=1 Tax=Sneathiella sp. TaxID=1964365 RepID=UPI000C640FEC|nr:hypothetical protein [Sneathiella sp.]MAZ02170.1 hypothetical protein [Sneathiella sp.]